MKHFCGFVVSFIYIRIASIHAFAVVAVLLLPLLLFFVPPKNHYIIRIEMFTACTRWAVRSCNEYIIIPSTDTVKRVGLVSPFCPSPSTV